MIRDLKPYPAYKDSGVPWIGRTPRHWRVDRLKALTANIIDHTGGPQVGDFYVALEHVESWTGRLRASAPDAPFDSQVKRFRAEDVLFGKLRPYLAKVTRPKRGGVCVGEFFVLRPRDPHLSPRYLEYLLRSKSVIDAVNSSTFGAKMPRADWQFVGGMKLPQPPLTEQSAIVRFLDHADQRIQHYVRNKKKLTALLTEQKQESIFRAVTRGIEPGVQLENSDAEWLGKLPNHWSVRRAKFLFREVDRRSTTGAEPLLSLRMHRGLILHNEVSDIPIEQRALIGFKHVAPGQIVMNRMRASIGMFGIATQHGLVSPDYAVLEASDKVDPRYFLHLFKTRAAGTIFRLESKGLGTGSSGFMRLYTDRFGTIQLPFPPLEEQQAIVQKISTETAVIDQSLAHANQELQLLNEYRSRLFSDIVTGKLDIREAASRLPDEPEEEESLGEREAENGYEEEGESENMDSPLEDEA